MATLRRILRLRCQHAAALYQYDSRFHKVTQEINYPAGGRSDTTVKTYNSTGDLVTTTTDYGTNAAATTYYVWSNGLELSATDPDGNVTIYQYDGDRRVTD